METQTTDVKPALQYGKIYKIVSNHPEITDVYIGSTYQRLLSSRMSGHRRDFKQFLSGKNKKPCIVSLMFNKYGITNFHIELVEDYPCNNEYQLKALENKHIRNLSCINKQFDCKITDELISTQNSIMYV